MKIEDAKLIMSGYSRLEKQVRELALAKLKAMEADREIGRLALQSLQLTSFYVEGEHILVCFDYNEPYSGTQEVIIQASELEG